MPNFPAQALAESWHPHPQRPLCRLVHPLLSQSLTHLLNQSNARFFGQFYSFAHGHPLLRSKCSHRLLRFIVCVYRCYRIADHCQQSRLIELNSPQLSWLLHLPPYFKFKDCSLLWLKRVSRVRWPPYYFKWTELIAAPSRHAAMSGDDYQRWYRHRLGWKNSVPQCFRSATLSSLQL